MIKYGYINGCFQPLTNGHAKLIINAAKQVDYLCVFKSIKQRDKQFEWWYFEYVWSLLLRELEQQHLTNVRFVGTVQSPRKDVLVHLHWFDQMQTNNSEHWLFSDEEDMIEDSQLEKFCPTMLKNNQIIKHQTPRELTDGISGTKMRNWFKENNQSEFLKGLPEFIPEQVKVDIWNYAKQTNK